jgi:fucose 4-O-acetylase-like acetyltransferase
MQQSRRDKMSTDRLTYLDIAKGIGIILVVWVHALAPGSGYISQFHMPLFFFISGVLFNDYNSKMSDYIKRKAKALLFPFWKWNLILYPVFFILYYWHQWDVKRYLIDISEIILTLYKVPFLGATWFFPALFWIAIIFRALFIKLSILKYRDFYLLIISVAACFTAMNITFPFRISRVIILGLFYACGYLYGKYIENKIFTYKNKPLFIIALISFILIAQINTCNMGSNEYKYKILFIIGALTAIYCTLCVSSWLNKINQSLIVRQLIYLGENSMPIVIWQFLSFRLIILLQILINHAPINKIFAFPVYDSSNGWWIIYTLTGIYASLLWAKLLKKSHYFIRQSKGEYMPPWWHGESSRRRGASTSQNVKTEKK